MKFFVPDTEVSVRITCTDDCVTVHAGEIRFLSTGSVLCLREDYHWTVPDDVVEASGYLALTGAVPPNCVNVFDSSRGSGGVGKIRPGEVVMNLVLLVDELREGEAPFDPSDAPAQILWSVFYMRRFNEEGVSFRIYEPTGSVQPEGGSDGGSDSNS